jgi:carboxypeptidase C (cathepsin A)
MKMRRLTALLASAAAICLAGPAMAAEPAPVVTQQQIQIAGRALAYIAEAGRVAIRDVATGEPLGHLFYVAYRKPAPRGTKRPITFIWNGGPGRPAASLHFEGAGPRRIEGDRLVDNADTWLTDSDLVFVDPMATGFSRAVSPQAQKAFTSWIGDIAATTEFVRAWVLLHSVEDAPLVIAGQSYGSGRAGSVAYRLLNQGMNVKGVALISNTSGLPDYPDRPLIALAMHTADYAVTALHFGKLPPDLGVTPDAARRIAEKWARETYLPALRRIDTLSAGERDAVARDLARHIGLAPELIDRQTLRVTQGFFLGHIGGGKRLYYSDYRYEEPYRAPPLTLGVRHIRRDLGYRSDLPYLDVEPLESGFAPDGVYPKPVNATWTHSTVYGATPEQIAQAQADFAKLGAIGMGKFGPNLPGAGDAIALSPGLKVLVAHGAYDPLGGCSIDAELGRQLPSPHREAVTFRCYLSGHAIYRDAPARAQFANDMRALARAAAKGTP